ncbi:MAG: hydrogenase formation protein HypD [Thermoplasmatales archaeon]|nr:hydrogenase formation protein HypD [Thermoplasmatales archaeon]
MIASLRNKNFANAIIKEIKKIGLNLKIMHVCGTHQDTILKYGLDNLLAESGVEIVQGPGCPVCVTTPIEIEKGIKLAEEGITIATFGDMLRVPASKTLEKARSEGADVRVVYSITDAIEIAKEKETVFIAVGFETTAPATAISLLREPKNFSILNFHRFIPPALDALLGMGEIKLDGIICPGHVSTIIGTKPYEKIAKKYKIPHVIAGFEPLDVLLGVYMIAKQVEEGRYEVENEYKRCVRREGNIIALKVIDEVFSKKDGGWRGFPVIKKSKMALRKEFEKYDAEKIYEDLISEVREAPQQKNCKCGEVLRGIVRPEECKLFGKICNPLHPVGPCMVSIEGACNISYRYKDGYRNRDY